MSANDRTSTPSSNDTEMSNCSPSDQGNECPTASSTPSIKVEAAEEEYDVIKDEDLPSEPEPEMISASDAHEEPEVVSKVGIPRPDELEQNGKAFGRGGAQPVRRPLGEMNADHERKKRKLLNHKGKRSVKKDNKRAELEKTSSAGGEKDEKGSEGKEE